MSSTIGDAVATIPDTAENAEALRQRRRAALVLAQLAPDLLEAVGLKGYQGHDSERSGIKDKRRPVWREGVGSPTTWPEDWHKA